MAKSGLETRVAKLEQRRNESGKVAFAAHRGPDGELRASNGLRLGRFFAVLPVPCATADEWTAQLPEQYRGIAQQ